VRSGEDLSRPKARSTDRHLSARGFTAALRRVRRQDGATKRHRAAETIDAVEHSGEPVSFLHGFTDLVGACADDAAGDDLRAATRVTDAGSSR
jgi:hypothetical protein